MSAKLVRTERTFRRVDVFHVDGQPAEPARDGQPGLKPESVKIDMDREAEHGPWNVTWISVYGRRIRKDGTVGSSQASQLWSGEHTRTVPEWVMLLVRDVQATATREREIPREAPATT